MRVEIVSDVVCPWCFIGLRRFQRAVAVLGREGIDIEVAWSPFQLDPGAPLDDPRPVREAYAAKFGGEERAARILTDVTRVAEQEGLRFDMDRAVRANTFDAHRLLSWARDRDGAAAQHALAERLFVSYFEEGGNLADHDHLAWLCAAVGLAGARDVLGSTDYADTTRREIDSIRDRGISAVPTYVVDGRWSIPGAQDAETFERLLRRVATS